MAAKRDLDDPGLATSCAAESQLNGGRSVLFTRIYGLYLPSHLRSCDLLVTYMIRSLSCKWCMCSWHCRTVRSTFH